MKNLFKILLSCFVISAMVLSVEARPVKINYKLENLIQSSTLNKSATVAVSVKEAKTGVSVYENNQDKLLHPASTLKLFTTAAAIDALGKDYSFKTQMYIDKNNDLYIKLGADPLLTSLELKTLVKALRANDCKVLRNVYLDDSIVDSDEWGTGWMWDDDVSPFMPKYSAYNLDGNLFRVNLSKNVNGTSANVSISGSYPVAILNKITIGAKNDVKVKRQNWLTPDVLELTGCINSDTSVEIPINNMRRYFIYKLNEFFTSYNIKCQSEDIQSKLTPKDAKLIAEISHSNMMVLPLIYANSNNMAAESFAKVASGKVFGATGTTDCSVKMFDEYFKRIGTDTSSISVVDMSGVSRNNLLTTSWMTDALSKMYIADSFPYLQQNLAQPGDGTLSSRLLDLRGEAWLKTGSIANISGLTGYVKAQNGKTYAVAILIQNFKVSQKEVKTFEDDIIKLIYSR